MNVNLLTIVLWLKKDRIVLEARVKFRHNRNVKIYNTYLYIEQSVNGQINGNIALTWTAYQKLCGFKPGFVTGKTHYLLFTTRNYIVLVKIDIITNIITDKNPLYELLYMELFKKHPIYSIEKPHIPLKKPTLKELLDLVKSIK